MIAEQKEACKRSRTYWWGQLLRRLPCKTHYPGSVSCKEILLSGNVNHNKGTQEGPRKVSKRYDMMAAISTNIWFYVWDIVGQKKGPQHVYSYSHVTRFVYRSVEKLENIMRRTWVASILLHHKLDVQQTTVFFFFFFAKITVQRACFVMKLGTITKNRGKQQKYCRIWASCTPL